MNSSLKMSPQHFDQVKKANKILGIIGKKMENEIKNCCMPVYLMADLHFKYDVQFYQPTPTKAIWNWERQRGYQEWSSMNGHGRDTNSLRLFSRERGCPEVMGQRFRMARQGWKYYSEHSTYEASDSMVVLQTESKQKEVLSLHNAQLSHGIHCYRMFRMPKYI